MAKQAQVICPVCKQKFYREDEPGFVHKGNRYYHKACIQKKEQEEEYRNKIHEYCKMLYGSKYSKSRITKQINELLEDGTKSITGIYKTLIWHYEYNHGDVDKAFGSIRIVDYVYSDAEKYYHDKWEREQRQNAALPRIQEEVESDVFHIHPTPIYKPKRVNLFEIH